MDYESPPDDNTEFAHAESWSVQWRCRCGQSASLSTHARYVRTTCRSCGTVWEIAPSFCDSTPYTAEKGSPEAEETTQPDGFYELIMTVQGLSERLDKFRWDFEHHSHHIHSEQVGTLGPRVPEIADYYSQDQGPTPKDRS